jgi:RNA polymerase primary sigma factor
MLLYDDIDEIEKLEVFVNSILNERERAIIKMRFGIDCEKEHTLKEVAEYVGVSSERVRQIEAKSLKKMREPLRGK